MGAQLQGPGSRAIRNFRLIRIRAHPDTAPDGKWARSAAFTPLHRSETTEPLFRPGRSGVEAA
jgi:hypothetical protein